MKQFLWITISLLIADHALCRSIMPNIPRSLQSPQTRDHTGSIYACVDSFLASPTEENLAALEACEESLPKSLQSKDEYLAYVILLCNKGYYSALFTEIHKSADAYERAWKIYEEQQLTGFDIIEYCLKPLGNNYSMLGDYQSAANIIRNYLFIAQKESNSPQVMSALINLSIVYQNTGRYEDAIGLLTRALDAKGIRDGKKGLIYSNLARSYLDSNNIPDAQRCATLAIQHFKKSKAESDPVYFVNTYKTLSSISLRNGNATAAETYLRLAREIVNEKPGAFKPRELAKLENDHAAVLILEQQYDQALENYQKALTLLLPRHATMSKTGLPDKSLFYAENTIKETLDGLADLFVLKDNPHKALECLELSFVVEDLLRNAYHYQEARLGQQAENRDRAEQAISLLYDLFTQTKDHKYITKAFQVAERTKAIVLREAIEDGLRTQFLQHHNLLKKEQALSYKKAKLENELVLEQMKDDAADVSHINLLLSKQTGLSLDIKAVKREIAEKYPQHNFHSDTVDIGKLQKKLKLDNVIMLEYFTGKEFLYLFVIDEHSISLYKIQETRKSYDNANTLNELFADASAINNDIERYKKAATELYQQLQIPHKTGAKDLLIIPDGTLNYIPFEALLHKTSRSTDYNALPYLITKCAVTYKPSASIYANDTLLTEINEKKVLAMFPVFKDTDRVLKHSQQEAKNIQDHIPGIYFFAGQATKQAFEKNLGRYSIIHLSTHADAGSLSEPPSIAFIDSTLYLPEVYGLRLQPDLLVLSACETGAGKLLKGEGALSLARGFQYAGARNIIFSLWKVNDQSTASLISSFYQHYADDKPKSLALKQAKLDYLANDDISNARKSPYYWAAFVYYGDPHTSVSTDEIPYLVPAAFLFVIIGMSILIRKALKNPTS
jgi:CHAT domain-containing protein/tetratricopeptide (TPR) repeat protein